MILPPFRWGWGALPEKEYTGTQVCCEDGLFPAQNAGEMHPTACVSQAVAGSWGASCLLSLALLPGQVSLAVFALWGSGGGKEPESKVRVPDARPALLFTCCGASSHSTLPAQPHASIPSLHVAAGNMWASQSLDTIMRVSTARLKSRCPFLQSSPHQGNAEGFKVLHSGLRVCSPYVGTAPLNLSPPTATA